MEALTKPSVLFGGGLGGIGEHSTMDSILASHPATPGLILGNPKNFSIDVAENY